MPRQLAGSALNLNPHLHILFCDGVFSGIIQNGVQTFRFRNLEAITDKEVEKLLLEISSKILKLLKKHGYLNHDGEMVNHPLSDSLFRDHESLAMATFSSIVGTIAFGPNASGKSQGSDQDLVTMKRYPWPKATDVFLSTAFLSMLIPRPIHWLEIA
jgi:hypothetical protein